MERRSHYRISTKKGIDSFLFLKKGYLYPSQCLLYFKRLVSFISNEFIFYWNTFSYILQITRLLSSRNNNDANPTLRVLIFLSLDGED